MVTNNNENLPDYIVSIITCSYCRFRSNWSNCEWNFYDPIHTIEKHAQAHVFSTDFFVIAVNVWGAVLSLPYGSGVCSSLRRICT